MTTPFLSRSIPTFGIAFPRHARPVVQQAKSWIATAWKISRERHQLSQLDDRMLRDIGIRPDEANREASRDVFDLPRSRADWL